MFDASQSPPSTTKSTATQSYYSEEVQGILSQALELRSAERYSLQQLQEMATELSISPELLHAAEANWRSQQATVTYQRTVQTRQQHHRRQQWLHYACGSALIIGINVATAGMVTWAIFPVMGWGLSLALGRGGHRGQWCSRD